MSDDMIDINELRVSGYELFTTKIRKCLEGEKYRYLCQNSEVCSMDNIRIRKIRKNEIGVLEDMLYEAIYQPDENNPIPRSVLQVPEVNAYIKDFGSRKDDYCFVADANGKIVGAVWVRIISGEIKGYGNVDDNTPEFSISLFKEYRNRGIGTRLMYEMIEHLKENGYKQASLSVQNANYAVKLYQKVGFKIINDENEDYLMVLKL